MCSRDPHVSPSVLDQLRLDRLARLRRRDPHAEGEFWCSVVTTRIYCRPTCPSRQAKAENIRFHDTLSEARATGFSACRRCSPEGQAYTERQAAKIELACRILAVRGRSITSRALAAELGVSPSHLHRMFQRLTGMTPLAWVRRQTQPDHPVKPSTVRRI